MSLRSQLSRWFPIRASAAAPVAKAGSPSDLDVPSTFEIVEAESVGLELQAAEQSEDGKTKVRKFAMTAYSGGKLALRNFPYPVVVDLAGLKGTNRSRPILRDHDPGRIVGHTDTITVQNSVKLTGHISAANEHAREIAESADNGFPWQASIGATAHQVAYVDEGERVTVNGRRFVGPLYVARSSTLRETSFVAMGADDQTSARLTATRSGDDPMNFEHWLEAKAIDATDLAEPVRVQLRAAFEAETKAQAEPAPEPEPTVQASGDAPLEPDGDDDPIADMTAAAAAETERIRRIGVVCARYGDPTFQVQGEEVSLAAHAIGENWTLERTELEALRESRPKAPAGHSHSHDSRCSRQALEGALILRAGRRLDDPAFVGNVAAHAMGLPDWLRAGLDDDKRAKAMEAAHRYAHLSAVDLCAEALRLDGKQAPRGSYEALIHAAMSGGTLTNIFTTNAQAILLSTYVETTDTTQGWTRPRDVPNFKTNERVRMKKGPGLTEHARGGKADHGDRDDTAESYKIARYSEQLAVDEMDFIDDDLSALEDTLPELGRAARRLVPDLVYAILLSNPTLTATGRPLFNTTDGSLISASAPLTSPNLKAAIASIEKQQENSVNLNFRASHLIVPSDVKHTGAELIRSATIVLAGTAGTVAERGSENTLASIENLTLVSDSRLSNGVFDPDNEIDVTGSVEDWYLASSNAHTIEVGYRRGTGRAPQLTSWRKNGEDGMWVLGWSVKHDVGAKALDFRGLRKNDAS